MQFRFASTVQILFCYNLKCKHEWNIMQFVVDNYALNGYK